MSGLPESKEFRFQIDSGRVRSRSRGFGKLSGQGAALSHPPILAEHSIAFYFDVSYPL
jgi:hypothetical protein